MIIIGDADKDGEISIFDIILIKRFLLELSQLDSLAQTVADVNSDKEIDVFDIIFIKRHLLGLSVITQPSGEEKVYEKVIG